jgi:hypothetical protein
MDQSTVKRLRAEILDETKKFLIGLESGASTETLNSILLNIKQKENELIQQEGSMLAPEMWRLLQLLSRRNEDGQKNNEYL